jgi:exosortase
MVITLFGVVLTLCGWEVMKVAWFPIAFLICALPLPGLLYSQIALPLQHLAARVAVAIMQTAGVFATYAGTKITVGLGTADSPIRTLNVAEACAGMRSLMTFISVGAAVAFLSSRPLWQRLFITASAVPIAIFCNVLRVTGQGFLEAYGYRDMASGFAHQFVGLVMLIPAFFLILLVGWILDQLFIEEVDVEKDVLKKGVVVRGGVIERRPTAFEVTASNADAAPAPAAAQTTAPEVKPAAPSSIPRVIPPRPNLGRPTPPPKATARRPIVPPTTGGHPSSTGVSKP